MSFSRYEPDEMPHAIARTVRRRWPAEKLLLAVPCQAEWFLVGRHWPLDATGVSASPDPSSDLPEPVEERVEPGILGITSVRLVFQSRNRPGVLVRVAAAVFAILAALGFLSRATPAMTPIAAVAAVVLWFAGRAIEAWGIGSGCVRLDKIVEVDRDGGRIRGVDDWGVQYRLRLADADLDRVARLVPH